MGGNSNFLKKFWAEIVATPRFAQALNSVVIFILQNSNIDSTVHFVFNTCIPGDRFFVSPGGPHQRPTGAAGTIYPRPGPIFYADYEFWVVIFRISIINEIFESEIYSRYAGVKGVVHRRFLDPKIPTWEKFFFPDLNGTMIPMF